MRAFSWTYTIAALLTASFLMISAATAEGPGKESPKGKKGGPPGGGMPPAKVVVAEVTGDVVTDEAVFTGTVYYDVVSNVAAEVKGSVEATLADDGERVRAGDELVRLDSRLLKKSIESKGASHGEALSELKRAEKDHKRAADLFKDDFLSEQLYDEARFRAEGLKERAASLKADLDGLTVELEKKSIRSPFDGVVIRRHVEVGEWLASGSLVTTVADDRVVNVEVEVPQRVMLSARRGTAVRVAVGGRDYKGKVSAVVPMGDTRTRTFPVKIRVTQDRTLIEGMEARVWLPVGEPEQALIVPRDAVIEKFGKNVVFIVDNGKAAMVPVDVIRFRGKMAAVASPALEDGMQVVVKGNERLRDGQGAAIVDGNAKGRSAK